jgi:hypothetical protein
MRLDPKERLLVAKAIRRIVKNVAHSGGVINAMEEARRLKLTYPGAGLSEAEIFARFAQRAQSGGILLATDPASRPPAFIADGQPSGTIGGQDPMQA